MDAPRTPPADAAARAEPVLRRILAATDLGPVGDAAIRVAHARASEIEGGRLAVCHVLADPPDDPAEAAARVAQVRHELTTMLEATLGAAASQVEVFVPLGDPAKQIHDAAEAWNADLVVIGRPDNPSGILARLFRPNVVEKVLRWSPCAVLVTRRAPGTARIVVGMDFADPSMPVLRAAAAEQQRSGAQVFAVHCVPPSAVMPIGDPAAGVVMQEHWGEIEEAMRRRIETCAREAGLAAAPQIVQDGAAHGLVQLARDLAADLVVVGSHGRGGLARLALGDVSQDVVNDAPCPVLVVRLTDSSSAAS